MSQPLQSTPAYKIPLNFLGSCQLYHNFIRDSHLEHRFNLHGQFDQVERIGVEIHLKRDAGRDLTFVNSKLINDNPHPTLIN